MAAIAGQKFVPLGGIHDGRADGLVEQGLFVGAKAGHFMQASIQEDFRAKIRQTVARLKDVGRDVATLTYCTSRSVPLMDQVSDELAEELKVNIRIRDQRFFVSQVNSSPQTVEAYESYLAPQLAFLREIGASNLLRASPNLPARTLCVFLAQEVEHRRGNTQLLEAVTDSLILWALDGTDPDNKIFMSRDQVLAKIEEALPAARTFIRGVMDDRLSRLTSKTGPHGREIRYHTKEDAYCLSFETRELVFKENAEDEILKLQSQTSLAKERWNSSEAT